MDKTIWILLAVAVIVGTLLSPLASAWPDGLERVAENLGFIQKGEEKPVLPAPIADYTFPGISNEILATAFAGFLGTLLTFCLVYGLLWLISRKKRLSGSSPLILILILISSPAFAIRPLETEDAAVLGARHWQFETGVNYIDAQSTQTYRILEVVNYGLRDNTDIGLELPHSQTYPVGNSLVSGLEDLTVKVKTRFNENISGKISVKLCTADHAANLSNGLTDIYLIGVYQTDIKNSTFIANLGYDLISINADIYHLNLAWLIHADERFDLVGEVTSATTFQEQGSITGLLGLRTVWGIGTWDLGFRRHFNETQNTFTGGLTLDF